MVADDDPIPVVSYRPTDQVDLDTVVKSTFISMRSDTLSHVESELGERVHVIPGSIPLPGGSNGEVAVRGVNKGSAILEVLEILERDVAGTGRHRRQLK